MPQTCFKFYFSLIFPISPFSLQTRYLQAQNKKLKDELNGLKNRWGKETEKIRQMYDVELKQLRRLLDDAERLKGEKDARISSLDSHNKDMREQ